VHLPKAYSVSEIEIHDRSALAASSLPPEMRLKQLMIDVADAHRDVGCLCQLRPPDRPRAKERHHAVGQGAPEPWAKSEDGLLGENLLGLRAHDTPSGRPSICGMRTGGASGMTLTFRRPELSEAEDEQMRKQSMANRDVIQIAISPYLIATTTAVMRLLVPSFRIALDR
jgi:hypothetical protein